MSDQTTDAVEPRGKEILNFEEQHVSRLHFTSPARVYSHLYHPSVKL